MKILQVTSKIFRSGIPSVHEVPSERIRHFPTQANAFKNVTKRGKQEKKFIFLSFSGRQQEYGSILESYFLLIDNFNTHRLFLCLFFATPKGYCIEYLKK